MPPGGGLFQLPGGGTNIIVLKSCVSKNLLFRKKFIILWAKMSQQVQRASCGLDLCAVPEIRSALKAASMNR